MIFSLEFLGMTKSQWRKELAGAERFDLRLHGGS
jgi:hypothetical protein